MYLAHLTPPQNAFQRLFLQVVLKTTPSCPPCDYPDISGPMKGRVNPNPLPLSHFYQNYFILLFNGLNNFHKILGKYDFQSQCAYVRMSVCHQNPIHQNKSCFLVNPTLNGGGGADTAPPQTCWNFWFLTPAVFLGHPLGPEHSELTLLL